MKLTINSKYAALLIALSVTALPVLAADDCDVPIARWQPREAVLQMAAQKGWKVQRLKIDDGCYELRGIDRDGQRFKAKLDPETLVPVKMKVRERDRERKHGDAKAGAFGGIAASFSRGGSPREHFD